METEGVPTPVESAIDRRHPFLTFMLWWLAIGNILATALGPFLFVSIRRQSIPDFPEWSGWAFATLSILAVLCTVALFRRRKWGFYGYALVACAVFALNVHGGVGTGASALGFVGTAALFIALQMGGVKKAWSRLT